MHTAAVVALGPQSDGEAAIVRPSVEGVRTVLSAAAKAGTVRRVVQTSSIAAVMQLDVSVLSWGARLIYDTLFIWCV